MSKPLCDTINPEQHFNTYKPDMEQTNRNLTCSLHSKRIKEYLCVTCDLPVCSDCIAFGQHKKHSIEELIQGVIQIVKELKLYLNDKGSFVLKLIGNLSEARERLKEEFQEVINVMSEKMIKAVNVIDKRIQEFIKVKTNTDSLLTRINTIYETVTKEESIKYEYYANLMKEIKEIKELKQKLLIKDERSYFTLPMNQILKSILDLKVHDELFCNKANFLFQQSDILKATENRELVLKWVGEAHKRTNINLELLWKGTYDGFSASTFHSKCDDKGPTLTVILSRKNCVFGGYTSESWKGIKCFKYDPDAFIFSLVDKAKYSKQSDKESSIYCDPECGPVFGKGFDLYIADNCNANYNSYTRCCLTYNMSDAEFFIGSHLIKEIEVYSVSTY